MKKRSEIEEKFKWDLTKFCKSNDDFYARLSALDKKIADLKKYEGKLGTSDKLLFECLEDERKLGLELETLNIYASLSLRGDNADKVANEMCELANITCTKFSVETSFISVELAKIPDSHIKELQKNARFKDYRRDFDHVLRTKKHILSKKEELLLSKMGEFMGGHSEDFDKFADVNLKFADVVDSKGKKHALNHATFTSLTHSKDRQVRKEAYTKFNGGFGGFIDFLASNYINDVKETVVCARIRKYDSVLGCKIYNEEASVVTYNLLIKKVHENIDIMAKIFEIKRKMLKLDKIAVYDTFAPIVSEPKAKFTFDEAIDLIKRATSVLGEEYTALIDRAVSERWIDIYPNENKDSGAFELAGYMATPVVLTNFDGTLSSVFTLAHELGHAMHSYFSNKTQPSQTAEYCIFVAEVASTTNEMLLLNYLLERAKTTSEKLYYYNYLLVNVRSTIFRQTMFSEFEQFVYETYEKGTPLTRQLLCEKYASLNKFYHGKKVEQIDEMQYEWSRIPHFFTPFYVYKYATGLICAINISNKILTEGKPMRDKYIKFLSAGSTKSPIELLRDCECDLEKDEIYDDVFAYCKDILKDWQNLIK